jgi:hypothetical protein
VAIIPHEKVDLLALSVPEVRLVLGHIKQQLQAVVGLLTATLIVHTRVQHQLLLVCSHHY